MTNDNSHIEDEVIARYLAGEAGAEDRWEVELWMNESETNRTHFAKLKHLWERTGSVTSYENADVDVDKAWNKFKSKAINRSDHNAATEPKARLLWPYFVRVAAVLVAGLAIYLIYQTYVKVPAHGEMLMASKDLIENDTLPDGTIIWLNAKSQLRFPGKFPKNKRLVSLQGEAFFKVAPNSQKPFVINVGAAIVTVLGTSFYVRAYDSLSAMEVGVEEGRVRVRSYGKEVILNGGDRISIQKDEQEVSKLMLYNPNDVYWKSETLVFQGETLANVFSRLEQAYGIIIDVEDPRILKCRLTGKFYQESVSRIFEIIDANFGLVTKNEADRFIVSGNGCD